MNTFAPFARPMYIMAKPVGSLCNLACHYCYYLEKAKLYQDNPRQIMTDELLEKFIKEYIESQTMPQVLFTWHGGETLMRPLDFYKKVVALQRKYAGGRTIDNCIQTNGTLLTDDWCRFFHDNHWLVGVSIDGPQEFHDEYRKNKQGKPSFVKVMQGINLLNKHQVEWNALAVVNDFNADYPLDFYHFFKGIGCRYIQFTPIVERIFQHSDGRYLASVEEGATETVTDFSVTPEQWGNFLCTIFDEWVRNDVGEYFIQLFDATLANWVKVVPGLCSLGDNCGASLVMEHNGDIFSCDHFVSHQYRIGNINTDSIREIINNNCHQIFAKNKTDSLPEECNSCQWKILCNGGCQKDRFVPSVSGKKSINYLCKGYKHFFEHTASAMQFMKNEILNRRPPSNIMRSGILNNQESTI